MKLKDLSFPFFPPQFLDLEITSITRDSRQVQPGTLFVAVQGSQLNPYDYLDEVKKKGAVLIVGERDLPHEPSYVKLPPDLDAPRFLSELANRFYGNPSSQLKIIGITGTNGKTTCAYLMESILKASGHRTGMIGTIENRIGSRVIPSDLTTPNAVSLQALLSEMKKEGCTAVVMEVSSHSLKQKRAHEVSFDGMLFTNLSPEHLDYHPDMEDYFLSKRILFDELAEKSIQSGKKPVAAINEADSYGQSLLKSLPNGLQVVRYSCPSALESTPSGIRGEYQGLSIRSSLSGHFNCMNLASVIALSLGLRVPPHEIESGIESLSGVPGRLEKVENTQGIHVWVDYAHKPEALQNVIDSIQQMKDPVARLITVFGCGGNRDRFKRPVMGEIASSKSDLVWVTSDNPRTEDPLTIIEEILIGIKNREHVFVEEDREKAIFQAISHARAQDHVLIAGKGHETYQIHGETKSSFDDREVARRALQRVEFN